MSADEMRRLCYLDTLPWFEAGLVARAKSLGQQHCSNKTVLM